MSKNNHQDDIENKVQKSLDDARIRFDELFRGYIDFYQGKSEENGICPTIDDF